MPSQPLTFETLTQNKRRRTRFSSGGNRERNGMSAQALFGIVA